MSALPPKPRFHNGSIRELVFVACVPTLVGMERLPGEASGPRLDVGDIAGNLRSAAVARPQAIGRCLRIVSLTPSPTNAQNVFCHPYRGGVQQPLQIDPIILSTFASSRSMAGLVPSSDPFIGPSPVPDDESAVPSELVPGAAALVPKAPPVTDILCDPIPPQTRPWSKGQC
jgi:hypothetical protein